MIHVERLPEPEILKKNKEKWTEKFINSSKPPPNSQYGHKKIRDTLVIMSFDKCYYCEKILKGEIKEIDHYIEVSERKDLAFDWNNLYLSCKLCNCVKSSNKVIPNSETLNPCLDSNDEIMKHLTFEDEQITAVLNSEKGFKTIQKYKLDDEKQDYLRMKKLIKFYKYRDEIKNNMINESRKYFSKEENQFLKLFTQKDQPYSLMFKILLSKIIIKKK